MRNRTLWIILGLVVLGILAYFVYRRMRRKSGGGGSGTTGTKLLADKFNDDVITLTLSELDDDNLEIALRLYEIIEDKTLSTDDKVELVKAKLDDLTSNQKKAIETHFNALSKKDLKDTLNNLSTGLYEKYFAMNQVENAYQRQNTSTS